MMNYIFLGAYLFLTIFFVEIISKKSLHKVSMLGIGGSLLSMLVFLDFILLFSSLTGAFKSSLQIMTVFMFILAFAGKLKIDYRQVGITPMDILLFKEAKSMAGALNFTGMVKLAVSIIASLALMLGLSFNIREFSLSQPATFIIIVINIILGFVLYITAPVFNYRISVYRIGILPYFLSFVRDPVRLDKNPSESLNYRNYSANKPNEKGNPDIIIIQSESFCDPTCLGGNLFNQDPLPFYHKLKSESLSFDMTTRAFGGGTVHTEFEVLTGLSTVFFPRDTTVFSRYLKIPTISLGSILKRQGYDVKLLHPYYDWFYNRKEVYRLLGFDEFHTISTFSNDKGDYVSDKDVNAKIFTNLKASNNLVFAVTMQNHTPYKEELYNHGIRYLGSMKNKVTHDHFNNYLNGLRETDLALEELIDFLRNREKETLLLFYGDHLPVINQDSTFFEAVSWSKHAFDSCEYRYDLSLSPCLIWSNKRNLHKNHPNIDCSFVLPILLKETRLDYPSYLHQLYSLCENEVINGVFRDFMVKKDVFYNQNMAQYKLTYQTLKQINSNVFYGTADESWRTTNDSYKIL